MGFKVTTLHNVRTEGIEHFLFVLEGPSSNAYQSWFDANFDIFGKQLGRTAAIVRGYNEELTAEIVSFLRHNLEEEDFLLIQGIISSVTCLLISKGHPFDTAEPVILVPLIMSDDEGDEAYQFLNELMQRILDAIRHDSLADFVQEGGYQQIELQEQGASLLISTLEELNKIIELKPNLSGIGLNLNQLIGDLLERHRPSRRVC